MTKDDLIRKFAKPVTLPLYVMQLICFCMMLLSLFTFIWIGWSFTWRLFLSGFIGFFIAGKIYEIAKKEATKAVDEAIINILDGKERNRFEQKVFELLNMKEPN